MFHLSILLLLHNHFNFQNFEAIWGCIFSEQFINNHFCYYAVSYEATNSLIMEKMLHCEFGTHVLLEFLSKFPIAFTM